MSNWYEISTDDELRQGEILFGVAVFVPAEFVSAAPALNSEQPAAANILDAIVITPSCDLVERKEAKGARQNVVFCQHWDLRKKIKEGVPGLGREGLEQIQKGRRPAQYLLPASPYSVIQMDLRIVDFSHVYSLPKSIAQAHARAQGQRLRLLPPFCEHFAQAFSRHYMRIGLPTTALEVSENRGSVPATKASETTKKS